MSVSSLTLLPETALDKSWHIRTLDADTATVMGEIRMPEICSAIARGNTNALPADTSSAIFSQISREKRLVELWFPYAKAADKSPCPVTGTGAPFETISINKSISWNSFNSPNPVGRGGRPREESVVHAVCPSSFQTDNCSCPETANSSLRQYVIKCEWAESHEHLTAASMRLYTRQDSQPHL